MASADIEIHFDAAETESGVPRFVPGATVTGSVSVTPDGSVRCNHLWIRLKWRTEGRGDRDEGKIDEQDVFQGTLEAGVPARFHFAFPLPGSPWSYAGHYVNIIWQIEVDVDVPWSKNPRHQAPFVMAPR